MVRQEKIRCSDCRTALVNVVVVDENETVSHIRASCWKCGDSSFVSTLNGKFNILGTTSSKVKSMRDVNGVLWVETERL